MALLPRGRPSPLGGLPNLIVGLLDESRGNGRGFLLSSAKSSRRGSFAFRVERVLVADVTVSKFMVFSIKILSPMVTSETY